MNIYNGMLDKTSLKILKKLYVTPQMTDIDIEKIAKDSQCHYTGHIEQLKNHNFISSIYDIESDVNKTPVHIGYSITLDGRAFIEDRQHRFWSFWLPYGITTVIALLSLISTLLG